MLLTGPAKSQKKRPVQAEERTGLCLLQECLQQRHISCHYLIMDQADCDHML